jgi:hypothetical protein
LDYSFSLDFGLPLHYFEYGRYPDEEYESPMAEDYDHLVLYPLAGLSWMRTVHRIEPEPPTVIVDGVEPSEAEVYPKVLVGCYLPMPGSLIGGPFLSLLGNVAWPVGITSSASADGQAFPDQQCRRLHAIWRLGLAPEPEPEPEVTSTASARRDRRRLTRPRPA